MQSRSFLDNDDRGKILKISDLYLIKKAILECISQVDENNKITKTYSRDSASYNLTSSVSNNCLSLRFEEVGSTTRTAAIKIEMGHETVTEENLKRLFEPVIQPLPPHCRFGHNWQMVRGFARKYPRYFCTAIFVLLFLL